MTDCPRGEVRDLLPDLLHDSLDADRRAAVESHVASCAACSDELALLRNVRVSSLQDTPALDHDRIARSVRTSRVPVTPLHRDGARRRVSVPTWVLSAAAALLLLVTGALAVMYVSQRTPAVQTPVAQMPDASPTGALVYASQGGLLVGALVDLDEAELESMLRFLPALDPYPEEDPPVLMQGFSSGEG